MTGDSTFIAGHDGRPDEAPSAALAPTRLLKRLHGIEHESELAGAVSAWRPHSSLGGEGARFVLGGRLGQGSQGVVFALRDRDAQRTVAFKTLNGRQPDPEDVSRFLHEVQVTAQLEHPGVVPVHDVGVLPDGTVFYTMKRVEGMVLGDWLVGRAGSAAHRFEVIQLFLKICDTMAFAHSRGVVHRDLKPRNIMVGTYGEVMVMDWGLAKVMGRAEPELRAGDVRLSGTADHETTAGTAIGTPAYMSPEQARGQLELVDHRSDIYGLGVILYEMLAAASPYIRGELRRTIQQVVSGQWLPLDRQPACRRLPRRLVAIVHRAMALRGDDRYQHVGDLAGDLRAFLAGESVSAYRETLADTLARLIDRHRRQLAWAGAAVAAVGLAAALTVWLQQRQERQAVDAFRADGALAVAEGDWPRARKAMDGILAYLPDDREALQKSGEYDARARQQAEDAARAATHAEVARRAHEEAERLRVRATALAGRGDAEGLGEAVQLIRQAQALHPEHAGLKHDYERHVTAIAALRAAAEAETAAQRSREAEAARRQQERASAEALARRAAEAEAAGDIDAAIGAIDSAIGLVPEAEWIRRKAGLLVRQAQQREEQKQAVLDEEKRAEAQQRRSRAEEELRLAAAAAGRAADLLATRARHADEVRRLRGELVESGDPSRRLALAAAEDAGSACQHERAKHLAEAVGRLNRARALAPDHVPVRAALAAFWVDRLREAEETGDAAAAAAAEVQARDYDDGSFSEVIAGQVRVVNRGAAALRLTPIRRTAERVDAPVGDPVALPVDGQATLAHGRYLAESADGVRVAVALERGRSHELSLPQPPSALAADAVFIPGGTLRDELRQVAGRIAPFVLMRREVTCGEWLEFLNDPAVMARIDASEQLVLVPRRTAYDREPLWQRKGSFLGKGGVFALETADGRVDPGSPVSGVSHDDALAYAAWRARREGRPWRLPTVEEWQFAVQGGDGRAYPWGGADDLLLCASAAALARDPGLASVPGGRFPVDRSVQGVLDLAGSRSEFCTGVSSFGPDLRPLMGGALYERLPERFTAWSRRDCDRRLVHPGWGVRLAYSP